jgi:hypothetical protein
VELRGFGRGRDVALVYSTIILVAAVVLALLPDAVAERVVLDSSTNLVNLRQHPPLVLILSAFVQPSLIALPIVAPLVLAYGAVQRWLGRGATIVTAVLGHVGATLFVATILAAGITKGRIGLSTGQVADVGASYGLVAAAGLLVARVPRRWLATYVGALSGLLRPGSRGRLADRPRPGTAGQPCPPGAHRTAGPRLGDTRGRRHLTPGPAGSPCRPGCSVIEQE